jgi:hypothetical protein
MKHTKRLLLLVVICISALNCTAQSKNINSSRQVKACTLLAQSDAEKILGQPVRLIENTSKIQGGVRKSDCVYRGASNDKFSGKPINLYFSLEQRQQNPTVEQARQVFESTYRKINEPDLLVQVLNGIGDKAFLISNPPSFHFIMVRKGEVIFRFKMNKAAEKTSLEELKEFAKKISEQI